MRALPNMTVVAPCDAEEMACFMESTLELPGPRYIRLAKGGDRVASEAAHSFEIGRGIQLRPEGEVALVATGIATTRALDTAGILAARASRRASCICTR